MKYIIGSTLLFVGGLLGYSVYTEIQRAKTISFDFSKIKFARLEGEKVILALQLNFKVKGNRAIFLKDVMLLFAHKNKYFGGMQLKQRTAIKPFQDNLINFEIILDAGDTINQVIASIKNRDFNLQTSGEILAYTSTLGTYITLKVNDVTDVWQLIKDTANDYLKALANKK